MGCNTSKESVPPAEAQDKEKQENGDIKVGDNNASNTGTMGTSVNSDCETGVQQWQSDDYFAHAQYNRDDSLNTLLGPDVIDLQVQAWLNLEYKQKMLQIKEGTVVDRGLKIHFPGSSTGYITFDIIEAAIVANDLDGLDFLLKSDGYNLSGYDARKCPLYVCCKLKRPLDFIKKLIEAGADPNKTYFWLQETSLHLAVCYEDIDVAQYLIQNGADVNATDKFLRTPLFWYTDRSAGKLEMLCMLLYYDADTNIANTNGETPFHCALKRGKSFTQHQEILLEYVIDFTMTTNAGCSLLTVAISGECFLKVISQIIERGLDFASYMEEEPLNSCFSIFFYKLITMQYTVTENEIYPLLFNALSYGMHTSHMDLRSIYSYFYDGKTFRLLLHINIDAPYNFFSEKGLKCGHECCRLYVRLFFLVPDRCYLTSFGGLPEGDTETQVRSLTRLARNVAFENIFRVYKTRNLGTLRSILKSMGLQYLQHLIGYDLDL